MVSHYLTARATIRPGAFSTLRVRSGCSGRAALPVRDGAPGVLDRVLGVGRSLLDITLNFVELALALGSLVAGGPADRVLHIALGFVDNAFGARAITHCGPPVPSLPLR